jgi:primary-amine oxidase
MFATTAVDKTSASGQAHTLHGASTRSADAYEIGAACEVVNAAAKLSPRCRFPIVRLEEPGKTELRGHAGGTSLPRLAFIVVLETETGAATEYIVDLTANKIVNIKPLPNSEAPYGQPPIMIAEFRLCEQIVKADEGWRAAMRCRGLSDQDMEMAQIDPFW